MSTPTPDPRPSTLTWTTPQLDTFLFSPLPLPSEFHRSFLVSWALRPRRPHPVLSSWYPPPVSHSLSYFSTTVSLQTLGSLGTSKSAMWMTCSLQFLQFHQCPASLRMVPRGPWAEQEESDCWDWNTGMVKNKAQIAKVQLNHLHGYYNQSDNGSHTLQGLPGCDMALDGRFQVTRVAEPIKNYLQGRCLEGLFRYLEKGKEMRLVQN